MRVKAWIEDGIVRCASQLCEDCTAKNNCIEGRLIVAESYWDNICNLQEKQEKKGLNKYKMLLEENTNMDIITRITYLQEELIDALMYIEHIKTKLNNNCDGCKFEKRFWGNEICNTCTRNGKVRDKYTEDKDNE